MDEELEEGKERKGCEEREKKSIKEERKEETVRK